jgi:hypothetical protein
LLLENRRTTIDERAHDIDEGEKNTLTKDWCERFVNRIRRRQIMLLCTKPHAINIK